MDNNQLDDYINQYLQFEFPAEVKLNRNYCIHEFNTERYVNNYDFNVDYTNFVPEATIDYVPLIFCQNPDEFYALTGQIITKMPQWTGDGSTTAFSATFSQNAPIQAGTVIVDDLTEVFTDDGEGVLTGSLGGTGSVNYDTGAVAVTFNTAPDSGQAIWASFIQSTVGRPTMVLMFNNRFTFYPLPDMAYRFRIKAWSLFLVKPASGELTTSFSDPTDRPALDEWGPTIAFGAARRIASDFGELDRYMELTQLYKEQVRYILTRTHIDLQSTRALPMF
jgi:hypothetical protein